MYKSIGNATFSLYVHSFITNWARKPRLFRFGSESRYGFKSEQPGLFISIHYVVMYRHNVAVPIRQYALSSRTKFSRIKGSRERCTYSISYNYQTFFLLFIHLFLLFSFSFSSSSSSLPEQKWIFPRHPPRRR